MKIRTLAVKSVAGVIVGGFFAGKLGVKAVKIMVSTAAKTPSIVKSFASDVTTEVKTTKTPVVAERALVVVSK